MNKKFKINTKKVPLILTMSVAVWLLIELVLMFSGAEEFNFNILWDFGFCLAFLVLLDSHIELEGSVSDVVGGGVTPPSNIVNESSEEFEKYKDIDIDFIVSFEKLSSKYGRNNILKYIEELNEDVEAIIKDFINTKEE